MDRLHPHTVGFHELSIGTAIAIERTLQSDEHNEKAAVYKYDFIYINILSIVRNYVASYDKVEPSRERVIRDCLMELSIIEEVYEEFDIKVIIYLSDNLALYRDTAYTKYLRPVNKSTKLAMKLGRSVLRAFDTKYPDRKNMTDYSRRIQNNSLLFTANSLDCLATNGEILQSHTGRILTKYMLPHLYTIARSTRKGVVTTYNTSIIPYSKLLVLLMGTKSIFKASPNAYRIEVIALAKQNNWTALTSDHIVRETLTRKTSAKFKTYYQSLPKLNIAKTKIHKP